MTIQKLALFFALAGLVIAQGDRPSPPAKAEVELKGKSIIIDYARPSVRGRKIMGGLVPYGEVWRTGANEATTLKTGGNLDINGAHVPAGAYTIYTLPAEGTWKLIINKQTGQWGTEYDQAKDLVRVDMSRSDTGSPVEQFTISFKKKSDNEADLVMEWEKTRLSVPVRVR